MADTVTINGQTYKKHKDGTLIPLHKGAIVEPVDTLTNNEEENTPQSTILSSPYTKEVLDELNEMMSGKTTITLRIDNDVVAWQKAKGKGYQTRINALLRLAMKAEKQAKARP